MDMYLQLWISVEWNYPCLKFIGDLAKMSNKAHTFTWMWLLFHAMFSAPPSVQPHPHPHPHSPLPLHWRHNDHDSVSNHQPHGCLLNRIFRRRSTKTSKLRVTGLCVGKSPGPVNSPHKGPVTRKIFPFDEVIMSSPSFSSTPSLSPSCLRHRNRQHQCLPWLHHQMEIVSACTGPLCRKFYHDMQISWPDSGSPPFILSDS